MNKFTSQLIEVNLSTKSSLFLVEFIYENKKVMQKKIINTLDFHK